MSHIDFFIQTNGFIVMCITHITNHTIQTFGGKKTLIVVGGCTGADTFFFIVISVHCLFILWKAFYFFQRI